MSETASMQDLTELNSVKEVKGMNPGELAVLIDGEQTYRDANMHFPANRVNLPDEVLEWIQNSDWHQVQIGFYTDGDHAGCFAIRIERDR